VLSAFRVHRGARCGRSQRVSPSLPLLVSRFVLCVFGRGVLAVALREAMLGKTERVYFRAFLVCRGHGCRDAPLSSADCRIYGGLVANKMKGRLLILGCLVVLLGAVAYLWGPSSAPAGQEPLTTLSSTNSTEFQAAFDAASEGRRLIVLLSPT